MSTNANKKSTSEDENNQDKDVSSKMGEKRKKEDDVPNISSPKVPPIKDEKGTRSGEK